MLTGKLQLYRGLFQNISGANATAEGLLAYTTDSQGLFVANGTVFTRVSPQNMVWTAAAPADLGALVQAAGGGALLGDLAVVTSNGNTYVLVGFANKVWQASTQYAIGDSILDSNGNLQVVTISGITGSIEPAWSESGTTNDNAVTWQFDDGFVAISFANNTHAEPLVDGLMHFVFDGTGDIIMVLGVPNT